MAKSRAEIQKAYRERKKQKEGESYLIKERQRRMQYNKPSSELTRTERLKRKKRTKKHCASGVKRKKKRRYNKIRDMTIKMKARY